MTSTRDIASAGITTTPDVFAEFPAVAARLIGWTKFRLCRATKCRSPACFRSAFASFSTGYGETQSEIRQRLSREAARLRPDLSSSTFSTAVSGEPPLIIVVSPGAARMTLTTIGCPGGTNRAPGTISVGTGTQHHRRHRPDDPSLQDIFEALPYVESFHRVTKPYKLVTATSYHGYHRRCRPGRESGRDGARRDGRPCSIENADHIFDSARAVRRLARPCCARRLQAT